MEVPKALMIDGKEYRWGGQIFHHENKARAKARRYLRWGRRVHVEGQGGIYCI